MSFDEMRAWGGEAEKAISWWLQGRGWYILPTYDYSGLGNDKAPKLAGRPRSLVLPDLMGAKAGRCAWLEVKRKTEASWTRKTSRYETGINRRLWDDYLQVQAATGFDASLIFVHEKEDEIRSRKISELKTGACSHSDLGLFGHTLPILRESESAVMGRMVFFCWDCLNTIGRTSEVLLAWREVEAA